MTERWVVIDYGHTGNEEPRQVGVFYQRSDAITAAGEYQRGHRAGRFLAYPLRASPVSQTKVS